MFIFTPFYFFSINYNPRNTTIYTMKKRMKILVAYDGSDPSKHALDEGVNLAKLTDSELTILSVVPRVMMPVFPDEGLGAAPLTAAQEMTEIKETMKEFYAKSLDEAGKDIAENYPELKVKTKLLEGRPSSTIVEQAENDDIDIIVIGSRGIGGITGWILGSTSRRVVESCTVPILVVK
jgi:nucleotide-binding universal stress UspA family protein